MPIESSWTFETLKERIEGEIRALSDVTVGRFSAVDARASEAQEAIKVGLAAAQTALAAAAALAKEAVTEAKAAHAAEHTASAMALALATLEMKEKLLEMNNLRQQITAERGSYVDRDKLESAVKVVEGTIAATAVALNASISSVNTLLMARISELQVRASDLETARANLDGRFTMLGAALGIAIVVIQIGLKFLQ